MGCLGSRSEKIFADVETLIQDFESSLGFNALDAGITDRTIHRFSCNKTMSTSQFSKAFSELKVKTTGLESFYRKFFANNSFHMIKLNTLGIVLGASSDTEKLKFLFQNYDHDVSGTLEFDEVRVLLEDITEIFCEFIPQYCLSLNSGKSLMYEYVTTVSSIQKSIVTQIISKLFNENKFITQDAFIKAYKEDDGFGSILTPHKLRSYCLFIRKSILKYVEFAKKTLDKDQPFNDFLMEDDEELANRNRRVSRRSARRLS